MSTAEELSERACKRAEGLFKGRLQRGGLGADDPEWYVQCEAGQPQECPGGSQVRVQTWRHWSDATVHADAETGEILHRCVDRLADPPTDKKMTQEEALQVADEQLTIPPGAELVSFRHEDFADGGRRVARLEWAHFRWGLRVDGDYLWVMIHPETRRVVALGRKWRKMGVE